MSPKNLLDLYPLPKMAREMEPRVHPDTLEKRLKGVEQAWGRKIIYRTGRHRMVDRAVLRKMAGKGGKSVEKKLTEHSQDILELKAEVQELRRLVEERIEHEDLSTLSGAIAAAKRTQSAAVRPPR